MPLRPAVREMKKVNKISFVDKVKDDKYFEQIKMNFLSDPNYANVFCLKLKECYAQKKLSREDILTFFKRKSKNGKCLTLLQSLIVSRKSSKRHHVELCINFFNNINIHLIKSNIFQRKDFLDLVFEKNNIGKSAYAISLELSKSKSNDIIWSILNAIIYRYNQENEKIFSDVLVKNLLDISQYLPYSSKSARKRYLFNWMNIIKDSNIDLNLVIQTKETIIKYKELFHENNGLKQSYDSILSLCIEREFPKIKNLFDPELSEKMMKIKGGYSIFSKQFEVSERLPDLKPERMSVTI